MVDEVGHLYPLAVLRVRKRRHGPPARPLLGARGSGPDQALPCHRPRP